MQDFRCTKKILYISTKTYVVGTQKNHPNETKHMLKLIGKKIFTILR